jgi:pimeloyl-ACP methyl ester carboxylesterase
MADPGVNESEKRDRRLRKQMPSPLRVHRAAVASQAGKDKVDFLATAASAAPAEARPKSSRSIGWIVAASLIAGAVAAMVLVGFVVAGAEEPVITGSVMIGFGFGWALLALLSVRLTEQPQRWAIVPAAYMMLVGAALILSAPSADNMTILGWVWPPVLLALVVWMFVQARKHLRSRTRVWLLYPVLGVLVLAALGGVYGAIRESLESDVIQTSGELVDVGGHRLYVNCAGSGSPTVVLEAGLWQSSAYWESIATTVAADSRVCVYDRAGLGQSDPAPGPQDGVAIATDLHALLDGAQVDGPYLLVGHSSGGVYVKIFASEYPDEVAGMVLLDAQPVEALTELPNYPAFYDMTRTISALAPSLSRLGVFPVAFARSVRDEFAELPTALQQGAALTSLGDRPLIVVTAEAEAEEGWLPLQERMVNLSTNSVQRLLPDATHASLIEDESDAAVASQAILDAVESVRTGTPLAES